MAQLCSLQNTTCQAQWMMHPSNQLHRLPGKPTSHRDRCRDKACHQREHFISSPWKEIPWKSIFPQKMLILGKTSFYDREWPQLKKYLSSHGYKRATFHSHSHWEGFYVKVSSTALKEVVKSWISPSQKLLIINSSDRFDYAPKLKLGGLEQCQMAQHRPCFPLKWSLAHKRWVH